MPAKKVPNPRQAVVTSRVPRDLPARIDAAAARAGTTRSTFIRDVLTAAVDQEPAAMPHAYPDPRTATVPDRAAHDAVKRAASTRPGRSDRAVPKADPTRVRVG